MRQTPNIEYFIEEVRRISIMWLTEEEKESLFSVNIHDRVMFLDLLYLGVPFKACSGCINNYNNTAKHPLINYKDQLLLYVMIVNDVFHIAAPRILFLN